MARPKYYQDTSGRWRTSEGRYAKEALALRWVKRYGKTGKDALKPKSKPKAKPKSSPPKPKVKSATSKARPYRKEVAKRSEAAKKAAATRKQRKLEAELAAKKRSEAAKKAAATRKRRKLERERLEREAAKRRSEAAKKAAATRKRRKLEAELAAKKRSEAAKKAAATRKRRKEEAKKQAPPITEPAKKVRRKKKEKPKKKEKKEKRPRLSRVQLAAREMNDYLLRFSPDVRLVVNRDGTIDGEVRIVGFPSDILPDLEDMIPGAPEGTWLQFGGNYEIDEDWRELSKNYQTFPFSNVLAYPQRAAQAVLNAATAIEMDDNMIDTGHKPRYTIIRLYWTPDGERPDRKW